MKTLGKLLKENLLSLGPRMKAGIKAVPAHVKLCFSKEVMKSCFTIRGMVFLGLLVAMSVVLRVFTSINIGPTARVELGFLPIAVAGVFFGPLGGALGYTLADLLGTLLSGQPLFFPITVCKLVFGFLFGLFFCRKRLSPICVFLCCLSILLVVDLFGMTLCFSLMYGDRGIKAILTERIFNAAATFPLRFFVIFLTDHALHIHDLWRRSSKNT
ncbi:MAG: folate family ECF transporter S component [Clostridia bacterium]|nr:folate family ECF transporter S component [Clostridia bacterium]